MKRRIWIILRKDKVEQSDIDDAQAHHCPEIANGIPPALEGIIPESQLPIAYEELESLIPPPVRNLETEIDVLKTEIEKLKAKLEQK